MKPTVFKGYQLVPATNVVSVVDPATSQALYRAPSKIAAKAWVRSYVAGAAWAMLAKLPAEARS